MPLAVQQRDSNGQYPLHIAYENGQSEFVLTLLIKKYPAAVQGKMITKRGGYLIHDIMRNTNHGRNFSEAFIELLIDMFPNALKETDDNNHYPLNTNL